MWAIVKNNQVVSVHIDIPSELLTGDKRYDKNHLSSMTTEQKENVGVYPVSMAAMPDSRFHKVSSVDYSFADKKVTQTYKSSDIDLTELKTNHKGNVKKMANSLISRFSWLVERKVFASVDIPSAVTTYVAAVRTKSNSLCTSLQNASNITALKALFEDTVNSKGEVTAVAAISDWPSDEDVLDYLR